MPIRYVLKCFVCEGLFGASRTDALTCGIRCRVFLHRRGKPSLQKFDTLRGMTPRFVFQECATVQAVRPDLMEHLLKGGPAGRAEVRATMVQHFRDREEARERWLQDMDRRHAAEMEQIRREKQDRGDFDDLVSVFNRVYRERRERRQRE